MKKINPWLKEKLELADNQRTVSLLVECEPEKREEVKASLHKMGIRTRRQMFSYIEIPAVSSKRVPEISDIEGVEMVHYSMPKHIYAFTPTNALFGYDPLAGKVVNSPVEVPRDRIAPDLSLPLRFPQYVYGTPVSEKYIIIGTAKSRTFVRDIPSEAKGKDVTVAVLDTGAWRLPWTGDIALMSDCSTDPQPLDGHSHGSWCTHTATGPAVKGMFGKSEGVAPEASRIHIKVLNGVFGFGSSADIIEGMENAWMGGADVISMSLGGSECQGGCYQDVPACPECKTVKALTEKGVNVVVAAGNAGDATKEEGGKPWTIGCPGCAPDNFCVGSYSITDDITCYFSSRGPSNKSNEGHIRHFRQLKPDILAPGGGRVFKDTEPDEVLYSPEEGWLKGLYTGVKFDIGGCMKGTSQATPHLSGMLAVYQEIARKELGRKLTTSEIKSIFAEHGGGDYALRFVPEVDEITTMNNKNSTSGFGLARLSWLYEWLKK